MTCLRAQDKPADIGTASQCSTCVVSSGCLDPTQAGASCETPAIALAPHFTGMLPDGKSCGQVFTPASPTEAQICLDTLDAIFTSTCAHVLQLTPCLCGTADTAGCLAGTVTPLGAGYDLDACDLNSTSSTAIQKSFQNQTFGVGAADALVLCAAQSNCDCF